MPVKSTKEGRIGKKRRDSRRGNSEGTAQDELIILSDKMSDCQAPRKTCSAGASHQYKGLGLIF
jgi:hypothetical protein